MCSSCSHAFITIFQINFFFVLFREKLNEIWLLSIHLYELINSFFIYMNKQQNFHPFGLRAEDLDDQPFFQDSNYQNQGFFLTNFDYSDLHQNQNYTLTPATNFSRTNQNICQKSNDQEDIFRVLEKQNISAHSQANQSYKEQGNQFDQNSQELSSSSPHNTTPTTSYKQNGKKRKSKRLSTEPNKPSDDYNKNVAGHIFKRIMRLIFSEQFQTHLILVCSKWEIDVQHFKNYYDPLIQTISGPQSLKPFFCSDSKQDIKMIKMFDHLMSKILRKSYLLKVLPGGKMLKLGSYIEIKNKYLLYFSSLFK